MRRRTFLLGSAAAVTAGLVGFGHKRAAAPIAGELLGASYRIGHLLRAGGLPAPSSERRIAVAIVGGGIAGLTAGWKLARAGFGEFEILELEAECGGNSRFGENAVSRYPWGAHYVPVPSRESRAVRELFEELGVIEGYDDAGAPRCREQYLCFSPQERLFIHGRWQEGLLPLVGATRLDLDEYARFKDLVHGYRERRGADGRKAFVIPMSCRRAMLRSSTSIGCRFASSSSSRASPLGAFIGTSITPAATTSAVARVTSRRGPGCTTSPAAARNRRW